MGESDVEVFRRFHAAWTAGDLETVLTLTDPDVIVRPLHGAMFTRGEFRGHEGMVEWYRQMTEPWERFEAIVEDVCPTPEGAIGLVELAGYRGDERFHARIGPAFEMRAGRVTALVARNASDVEREIARLRAV